MSGTPAGIDAEAVTAWLRDRTEMAPPLRFEVIQGGRSNLTYCVTDSVGRQTILRRPPLFGILPSAHDVGREHRIIAALAQTAVPVPPVVGFEPDETVTGAPFYVMGFVEGIVPRDAAVASSGLDLPARAAAAEDMVDVLVKLHNVVPDEVGLGDLGRKDNYLARQLRRWQMQLTASRTRELPTLDKVHERLSRDIPTQGQATVVHGDYRLDNLIIDPHTGLIRAVLDWELTTLGDPLADVGLLLVYWSESGDVTVPLPDPPSQIEGFPGRAQLASWYAERSGRDLSGLSYYMAFGYWKLACILEGVYTRFATGAQGQTDDAYLALGDVVIELGERAAEAASEAGR